MTEEKFTELVNLYFDKEISVDDLRELKAEIAACPDRKQTFAERCRLHQAMRLALKPSHKRSRRTASRRSGSRSRAAHGANRLSRTAVSSRSSSGRGNPLPRWLLGSGMAASLALGFLLLAPVFRDTVTPGAQPALVGVEQEELQDPLASLAKSDLRRYAAVQQQSEVKSHSSLVAQMRLMGLRPEFTPEDKQLREVGLPAHYEPKHQVSQAELFQQIQAQQAIPEPSLLRLQEPELPLPASWPEAFQTAPVRFGEL